MNMKTFVTTVVFILIFSAIFLSNYSFPKKIDVVRDAISFVEYDEDPATFTNVQVKGTLFRPLFKEHRFEGKIIIDKHKFTEQDIVVPILDHKNGVNFSLLIYFRETKPYEPIAMASIYYEDNFERFTIVTREEWIGKKPQSLYYIVNGRSYQEAFESQKILSDKLGEDSFVAPQNSRK